MRYVWSRVLIMTLAIEGALFVLYYNFGPRGIRALQRLKQVQATTELEIAMLIKENQALQENIDEWKYNRFFAEKFAREKLGMQKEGEIIYYKNQK